MELTVDTRRLADTAAWVAKFTPTRPAVPVLAAMLLTATDDGTLTLSAFDYETSATAQLDAHVTTGGTIAVPARVLAAVTARLGEGETTLRLDAGRLHLACGTTRYALATLAAEDYPTLPEAPEALGQVDADTFATTAAQVAASAGTDEALPQLTGMHLTFGEQILASATDRYRMALHALDWKPAGDTGDLTALVPHVAVTAAARGMLGAIRIGANDRLLSLSDDTRTVTTTLMDGRYPDVKGFLDRTSAMDAVATVDVDTGDLVAAIDRATVVATAHDSVQLTIADGQITVASGSDDTGDTAISAHTDGQITVMYNPKLLVPVLRSMGAATIHLHLTGGDAGKPTYLTPADGEDGPARRALIAPMRAVGAKAAA